MIQYILWNCRPSCFFWWIYVFAMSVGGQGEYLGIWQFLAVGYIVYSV
jgi:hypothetical protein